MKTNVLLAKGMSAHITYFKNTSLIKIHIKIYKLNTHHLYNNL